ncbi:hypothetical protein GCM10027047_23110 [Rhodococcus aerolatus]
MSLDQSVTPTRRAAPDELHRLLADGAVTASLQPVVDLATGRPVAYEALARGPVDTPLHTPDALFAAARAAGRLTELDAACVRAALDAGVRARLARPWTLLVNLEPDSRTRDVLPAAVPAGLPVVVELTERALLADPAAVLATVDRVRQLGWGVALDDVGVDPASLALLPLLRPDVVKLDAQVVQRAPDRSTAALFSAVAAEAERTGAVVVAEGIETREHLAAARALGAQLGQGWLFGRPTAELPDGPGEAPPRSAVRPVTAATGVPPQTPFALAAAVRPVCRSDGHLLSATSRHLERQAAALGEGAVVLTTFQRARAFRPAARRYAEIARSATFVAALGVGLEAEPAPGVRGVDLSADDPLAPEWDLVVLGPHHAVLLAARPAPDDGRLGAGPAVYEHVLSHDRSLVVAAARSLAGRVTATRADG